MAKIIVFGSSPRSLLNFRKEMLLTLKEAGHTVHAVAGQSDEKVRAALERLGIQYHAVSLRNNQINVFRDWLSLIQFLKLFFQIKPDMVIAYTIKPVLWSGLTCRLIGRGVRFYPIVTGLGYAFLNNKVSDSWLRRFVVWTYRFSSNRANGVIFQNSDNRDVLRELAIYKDMPSVVVAGSGVNIEHYSRSTTQADGNLVFLLIARLLGDKGIREYCAASAAFCADNSVRCQILGPFDESSNGIGRSEFEDLCRENGVEYLGATDDVRPYIQKSSVVVSASYHEGMPRSVLEGMALGRPILGTNIAGTRETVLPGKNGLLVEAQSVESLRVGMNWFVENRDKLESLGLESRRFAEEKFDVKKVNQDILHFIGSI